MSRGSERPSAVNSWWARATAVLLLTTGCTGGETSVLGPGELPDPTTSLIATELVYMAGQDQEAEVGTLLPTQLQVQSVNDDGIPVEGAQIEWTFDHGRGNSRVTVDTVTTDDSGLASMQWELGTSAGNQTATAMLLTPSPVDGVAGPSAAPKKKDVRFRARGRPGTPRDLEVTPESGEMYVGQTLVLSADVLDRHGNSIDDVAVAWTTMDPSVVTTSGDGVVVGQNVGETTVQASAAHLTTSASVTVMEEAEEPMPVLEVRLQGESTSVTSVSIEEGQTTDLAAVTVLDGQVTPVAASWSSSDGSIAMVNSQGVITAHAAGQATVTADFDGQSVDVAVTVTEEVEEPTPVLEVRLQGQSASVTEVSMEEGETTDLAAVTVLDGQATPVTASWASSNGSIATVDSQGVITAQGAGQATVTADFDGQSVDVTVTVTAAPTPVLEVRLQGQSASVTVVSMEEGETTDLAAVTVLDGQATPVAASWSSSNGSVATVNSQGVITAQAAGQTTVTADFDGQSVDVAVTVTPAPTPVLEVRLQGQSASVTSVSMEEGETTDLAAVTVLDGQATPVAASWSSSNGSIASVDSQGIITAQSAGQASVTADFDGQSVDVAVTVTEADPGPGANLVFAEDWGAGFGQWDDRNTPAQHSIVSDPTGAGRGDLLRVDFASYDDAGWLAKWVSPPASGEMHVRTHFYLAAGWGSANVKLTNVAGNRSDNLWSSFGQAGVVPNGSDFFQSMTAMGSGAVSDRRALLYTYHPDQNNNWGDEDVGTVVPTVGAWHQLDHYVRLNDVGQSNGLVRAWIDGVLVYEKTNLTFRTSGILDLNMIMLSFNGGGLTGKTLYYDDVEVYDGDPGGS